MKAFEPVVAFAFGVCGLVAGALLAAALGRAVCAILSVNMASSGDAQGLTVGAVFLLGAIGMVGGIIAAMEWLDRRTR